MIKRTHFLAAFAVAALATQAHAGTIRLCTGAADGNYATVGKFMQEAAGSGTEIQVVTDTGGTWGNIDRTVNKAANDPLACDAMIGQPDGIAVLKQGYHDEDSGSVIGANPTGAGKLQRIGTLHEEFLHVICNKNAKISDLADLEKNDKASVALGDQGSGAWITWQNLVFQEDNLKPVSTRQVGGLDALSQVAGGTITCLLQPAGLHNGTVEDANATFGEDLILAGASGDKDFNDAEDADGKPLYEWAKIPSGTYPNLQHGVFSSSVETIGWHAAVYVNVDRVKDKNDRATLIRATANAKKRAIQQFGQ